ncbi:uncharacterized protein LOC116210121 isoform X1 [Punica granatum]|uniref:Uncharacterized protein LOC116210121 isoform X1 n=2 Tax=Punica granatum TaxID=22663 RepID=A0A6P8E4C6_PUNGR|nr:uncharacterized protein LOC116210121 isoform X1 [Punica granatum]
MGMKMAVPLRHAGSAMEGFAWNWAHRMPIENWARSWIHGPYPKQLPPPNWLTPKEMQSYKDKLVKSQGFDVDHFPHAKGHLIRPAPPGLFDPAHYDHLLQLAVANYTASECTLICNPRLVKSNYEACGIGDIHYITFEALDCAAGFAKEYEARVFDSEFGESFCHFCRVKGSKKIPPMPRGVSAPSRPKIVDYNPTDWFSYRTIGGGLYLYFRFAYWFCAWEGRKLEVMLNVKKLSFDWTTNS